MTVNEDVELVGIESGPAPSVRTGANGSGTEIVMVTETTEPGVAQPLVGGTHRALPGQSRGSLGRYSGQQESLGLALIQVGHRQARESPKWGAP